MTILKKAFCTTTFIFLSIFLLTCFSYAEKPKLSLDVPKADSSKSVVFKRKSPMGALFRSVVFPGWGQLYNKKYLKAGLLFGLETTFLTLIAIDWNWMNEHKRLLDSLPEDHQDRPWEYEQYKFYKDRRNLYLWSILATIFVSMFDAYVDAHLYDFKKEMERIGFEIHPDSEKRLSLVLCFNF